MGAQLQRGVVSFVTTPIVPAYFQGTPVNPTGTSSTTGVMMGLAGLITPTYSGRILAIATGILTASPQCVIQLRYGPVPTVPKPPNGHVPVGTAMASWTGGVSVSGVLPAPWSTSAIIAGLTVGTVYWLDVTLASGGGAATIYAAAICAHEF